MNSLVNLFPLMNYVFTPQTMQRMLTGDLVQVTSATGKLLPIVRDASTGRFVEIASAAAGLNPIGFNPVSIIGDVALSAQMHKGFGAVLNNLGAIQASLGVLQATTALIGVGTVASVALGAVNLYQMMKLKKAVQRLDLKVEDGFIDLKQALSDQGDEILKQIDAAVQDIKFEQHRVVLVRAYGQFMQALHQLRSAVHIQDPMRRDAELTEIRAMLAIALADYSNAQLLDELSAPGYLRRAECAWSIEQTLIITYQIQNEFGAVCDRLDHIQQRIRQDELAVIDRVESEAEIEFLFPEIARISSHDLTALQEWKAQANWSHTLSPSERSLLAQVEGQPVDDELIELDFDETPIPDETGNDEVEEPAEYDIYRQVRQTSHDAAILDCLRFMVQPDLRQAHEHYIHQQAIQNGLKALAPSTWEPVPDLAVANLYWYFKGQEQVQAEPVAVA